MIVLGIAAVAIIAVVVMRTIQQRRSKQLRLRFGPEYAKTMDEMGSRSKAESALIARQARVASFNLVPLAPSDAANFSASWRTLQERFVDNPRQSVVKADVLVRELMLKRGYPIGDFSSRAADISVDHPNVVANFRAAQAIATRNETGIADTEDLRKAIVYYRVLFDDLLEVTPLKVVDVKPVAAVS
jgi:hypothetical protein